MTVGQFGALFYNIENNLADLANKKKDRKKIGRPGAVFHGGLMLASSSLVCSL